MVDSISRYVLVPRNSLDDWLSRCLTRVDMIADSIRGCQNNIMLLTDSLADNYILPRFFVPQILPII